MLIGYCRVSDKEQKLDRQIVELKKYGCELIYEDKQSGKNFDRPKYKQMLNEIRAGDVIVVHELNRFGRNAEEIKDNWRAIINRNIDIVILNMDILDTRRYKELPGVGKLISDLVLALLSWVAEDDRNRILKAQREGIKIAKEKGVYKGKVHQYSPTGTKKGEYFNIVNDISRGLSEPEILKRTSASRSTVQRIKRGLKSEKTD